MRRRVGTERLVDAREDLRPLRQDPCVPDATRISTNARALTPSCIR